MQHTQRRRVILNSPRRGVGGPSRGGTEYIPRFLGIGVDVGKLDEGE